MVSKEIKYKNAFIEKSKNTHGDKYDYSKVEYINSQTKVCIICPEHGEFWQRPYDHSSGHGCPKCRSKKMADLQRTTKDEFIRKSKQIHGDKYDYSEVVYDTCMKKVKIICPEHGEFWQTPNMHLRRNGCPKCGIMKAKIIRQKSIEQFIQEAKEIHGDKYNYSNVEYNGTESKVCIICPEHGEFWQTPHAHISKRKPQGCPNCGGTKKLTGEYFINKAKEIHGDKYDYSKVEYKNTRTKICIICPEHGEFWQTPHAHISGKAGCPICNFSHLEREINKFLLDNNIKVEQLKRFEWLRKQSLDFYLPEYNIAIECQGSQHFQPFEYFGGEKRHKKRLELDKLKKQLCEENGVKLIYYSNLGIDYPYEVYEDKEKLLEEIKKNNIINSVLLNEKEK